MDVWLILLCIAVSLLFFALSWVLYFFGPRLFKRGNNVIVVVAVLVILLITRRIQTWNGTWEGKDVLGAMAIGSLMVLGSKIYSEIRKSDKSD